MQIFHKDTRNRPFSGLKEAEIFVDRYLSKAKRCQTDAETLRFASDSVTVDGFYIELGVYKARTINFISALNPTKTIHGFDSFKGLPEDWEREDKAFPKTSFALKEGEIPDVNPNVVIHPGWFNRSLPVFCKKHLSSESIIAFLHIDCDLYSSTREAFEHLGPYLRSGSIVIFDELYNYPGALNHEFKAFEEFVDRTSFEVEYLAFNEQHEQVVVKIL